LMKSIATSHLSVCLLSTCTHRQLHDFPDTNAEDQEVG
jgi:hypothetical protein